MHWYRWHPSTRSLLARLPEFGSAAVIGVESMRDLSQLRARYGFARVETFPALHAAEVSVDSKQLHALLATAASDPRIRYVAPLEPPRHLERLRNDPMLRTLNPKIDAPYEWEFAASRVDAALNLSPGSPTVLVGIIDSGVADIPDLTDKIASRWYYTGRVDSGDDLVGHGTAVASIIAANNDDGFGMAGFGGATRVISFRDDILSDESIAIAATKLVSLGVRIINISAGVRKDQFAPAPGRHSEGDHLRGARRRLGRKRRAGRRLLSGIEPSAARRRPQLRPRRRRDELRRDARRLLEPGDAPLARRAGQLPRRLLRRTAGALADRARLGRLLLPDVSRRRRRALHLRSGNLVLGAGSLRGGGTRLGSGASAQELRGRGDPQAQRAPPVLRDVEHVARLGRARRRRGARGRDREVERRRAQHQGLRLRPRRRRARARDGARTRRLGRLWFRRTPRRPSRATRR